MKVRLQVCLSADKSFPLEHPGPLLRIGRDPGSDLSLEGEGSQSVSWNHARLEITANGALLTDLGSSNGTFVNGKRIEAATLVQASDLIELGRTGPKIQVAELDLGGAAPAPPARAATAYERMPHPANQAVAAAPLAPGRGLPAAAVAPARGNLDTPSGGGTTRMLLVKLQTSQRRNMMMLGIAVASIAGAGLVVVLVLAAFGVVLWKKPAPAPAEVHTTQAADSGKLKGQEIYQSTLRSTVWVVVPQGRPREIYCGSGALVDRERKLVLTAQHVVGNRDAAAVFFPHYENGKAIGDKEFYVNNAKRLGIEGKVVARDVKHDLALIELASVPDEVPVLPIADASPEPGQILYSVGNPGQGDSVMWQLTTGTVRQVHRKHWRYEDGTEREADVIETQSPVNPGDSGGPVVDGEGKLVAVVAGSKGNTNLQTFFIDRSEIVVLLNSR